MVASIVQNLNGISIAYLMGLTNSLFAVLIAFGVPLSDAREAALDAFVNAAMIVLMHIGHRLGEQAATGSYEPPAELVNGGGG